MDEVTRETGRGVNVWDYETLVQAPYPQELTPYTPTHDKSPKIEV